MKVIQAFTEGHPDKVCDQIADAIVDEYLRRDPESHVDLSVMGSHGMLMIGGRVSSEADFDAGELARRVYKEIGYEDDIEPFVNIDFKSREEARRQNGSHSTVWVNGYATRETREHLPLPLVLGHTLARRIDEMRKNVPGFSWIRPDGKVQLVMEGSKPIALTVLLQHDEAVDHHSVQETVFDHIIAPILGDLQGAAVQVNPVGCFSQGGLGFDTGASNRKVTCDTYGGLIPFGSGGLAGKDPGRTERAAAYMARHAAVSIVSQGLAQNCLIRSVYSLGKSEPVFLEAKSGDGKDLTDYVKMKFDFRVEAIVERLDLRRPMYRATATYGHFGKEGLPWG